MSILAVKNPVIPRFMEILQNDVEKNVEIFYWVMLLTPLALLGID